MSNEMKYSPDGKAETGSIGFGVGSGEGLSVRSSAEMMKLESVAA